MRFLSLVLGFLLLTGCRQQKPMPDNENAVTAFALQHFVDSDVITGAVTAVVGPDGLIAVEAFGLADVALDGPSAPDVVITPAPKRFGKPCLTIAGSMIEPIAITVAGDEPDTAANSAQAITPASPRPPCQCPTIEEAKWIAEIKRLYDSYSKFLDDQVSWFRVAESTYDNYMSYAKQPKKK